MPAFVSPFIATLLLAAAPGFGAHAPGPREPQHPQARTDHIQLAQLTIEQRVIIRIPTELPREDRERRRYEREQDDDWSPRAPPLEIKEIKGPKCLALNHIRGAAISLENGVTMVTGRGKRFRVHFNRKCDSEDFYSGFYIEPPKDGALCAGRDSLHARNGSICAITHFTQLVPGK